MSRRQGLLTAALLAALAVPAAASARDYAIIARDILPSGQYGAVPVPAGATTQASMYDALTPLFSHVTPSALVNDFKPEPLGTAGSGPLRTEPVPHAGVTLIRDRYDVPHIYASTHDDLTWAAGWVLAEDRSLLLQQARYDSRVAALDVPGVSAFGLITSLQSFKPSPQAERELAKQTGVLESAGAGGRNVLHDIDVYLHGINAYFSAQHSTSAPFTRNDIYALNALKDQFVGEGGGDEPRRAQFLAALQQRLGSRRGFSVYTDLREANDPETPVSVPGRANFEPSPRSISGNVVPDAGSFRATMPAVNLATVKPSVQASNVLMVSSARSATHHPIMVAGPQIGYAYPGLILEMDLHAPGIDARGATTAPFPGYIFIGRTQDSAWSLTSAGLDQIDTYVETLCGHSRLRYLFRGRCLDMRFLDAGSLGGRELSLYRTVHGPVVGYARVHSRWVALARKRASYGRDVLDLLFYRALTGGAVHNVHQFFRAADQTPQTFNSFYVDDKNIGVFTSGLVPIRPGNVDPGLPIDGRGQEEWHGYVSFRNHPQGINSPSGEIVNWNNRTEAGYQAPDNNWALGSVHRVDLLVRNLGRGGHLTPAALVSAMNAAGTQDVREITLEPLLSKVLRSGRAPSPRDAKMLALLDAWHRHGGSRLDRTGNGQITDPGAAIMDTTWPRLAEAWASSVLDASLRRQLDAIQPRFDEPFSGPALPEGREQTKGWFIYMNKDLRTILGEPVRGRFHVRYCGGGNLGRCRKLLWNAVDSAGEALATSQGSNPGAWRSNATRERIGFVPGLLTIPGTSTPFTIRYTNRPSGIQQVVSFFGHAPADSGR